MSKEIRFCWEKNKKRRKSKVFDSLPSYDRLPANTFGLGKRAQCGANFFLYECYLFLFKEVESLGFHCIKVPDPRGISNFHDPMLEYLLKGNVKISAFLFFLSFFPSTLSPDTLRGDRYKSANDCYVTHYRRFLLDPIQFLPKKTIFKMAEKRFFPFRVTSPLRSGNHSQ